jgi:outer membrane protein TolC
VAVLPPPLPPARQVTESHGADRGRPLTLAEALDRLSGDSPRLASGAEGVRKAEAGRLGAAANFLPEVDLSLQAVRYSNLAADNLSLVGSSVVETQGDFYTSYASVSAQLNLFAGGRDLAGYRAATAELEAARAEFDQLRVTETLQALVDYAALRKVQRALASGREGLLLHEEREALTHTGYQEGSLALTDVGRVRMDLAGLQARLAQRQGELQRVTSRLAGSLGLELAPDDRLEAVSDLPPPPTLDAERVRQVVQRNPALVAARARVAAAREAVRAARGSFLPRVSVVASYSWLGQDGESLPQALEATRSNDFTVGLVVQQRLGAFVRETAAFQEAQAALREAEARQRSLQLKLQGLVRESLGNLETAQVEADLARQVEEEAQRLWRLQRAQVRYGHSDAREEKVMAAELAERTLERLARETDYRLAAWTAYAALEPERFVQELQRRASQPGQVLPHPSAPELRQASAGGP